MAEGSYGATGGSAKVSRSEGLTGIAVLVAVIAVIGFGIWYIVTKTQAIGKITGLWKATQDNAVENIVAGAAPAVNDPKQARTVTGDYYPVKTLTQDDYNRMVKETGVVAPIIRLGNAIVPPVILNQASNSGMEAAATVNRLGLNNEYVDLPIIQKGLVTLGEGIGSMFGVDLIQAGYDMRSDVTKSAGVV